MMKFRLRARKMFNSSALFPVLLIGFLTVVTQQSTAADTQVNTYTNHWQNNSVVASDPNGNFVVAWKSTGQDGSGNGIFARRYNNAGVALGGEFQVNTTTLYGQQEPAIAMSGSGQFVICWSDKSDADAVRAQLFYADGTPRGSEFQVNTTRFAYLLNEPSVAMSPTGEFVVTWTGENNYYGSDSDIYAQRFNADGAAVGSEFLVNSTTAGDQHDPAVALSGNGKFVVAWTHSPLDADGYWLRSHVRTQLYDATGTPVGAEYAINDSADYEQIFPSVAIDATGNYLVCWTGARAGVGGTDTGNPEIDVYVQKFSASGTAVGNELRVNTALDGYQLSRSIAMNGSGDFAVAWDGSEPADPADPNGTLYYDTYLQRFSATGARQGSEVRLNSYTTDNQSHCSVAIDSSGNTIATWSSWGQDGSGWGVYLRRLGPVRPPMAVKDSATLNEDTAVTIPVLANDSDPAGASLTITAVSAAANGTTSVISNNAGTTGIYYTPAANYFGTDSFTYTISNGNGDTATGSVNVTVLSVNDVPSFTKGADQVVNEDAGLQTVTGWATNLSPGPSNEAGQTLKFIVSTTNTALFATRPQVSPTGTLTYRTALNKHGSATVTLSLRDSGGTLRGGVPNSAPQTFTITVNPVNDAPVANAGPDQNVTQTGALTNVRLVGSGTDPDGDTLTYQWKKGTAVVASTATTTVALAPGRHTFTLLVTDPSGASDTDSVMVNVLPPASTAGVSVSGSGTIKVNTVARSFNFSVSTASGTPSGNLSYADTQNNKNVVATLITSVVVNSTDIRIYGKAKISGSGSYDFVVSAKENSQVTPAVADTFGITLSDGYTSGNRALASGDIAISSTP